MMARDLGGFDPQATYSAAAEEYARASNAYWEFLTDRTIESLDLRAGQRVLDAACGPGPATVAAARRVGPSGGVVGVDYAEGMLAVAQRNVAASGVTNVELRRGDLRQLPFGADFDAVICVLGIFFLDDMPAAARALWSHVRPGGRLAITTFGTSVWEPVLSHFVELVQATRPEIERVLPWRRTEDSGVLAKVFADAGIAGAVVREVEDVIPFRPEDWRTIVMGSGLRRIATDLGSDADGVISETARWAREHGIRSVRVTSNYATAVKEASR